MDISWTLNLLSILWAKSKNFCHHKIWTHSTPILHSNTHLQNSAPRLHPIEYTVAWNLEWNMSDARKTWHHSYFSHYFHLAIMHYMTTPIQTLFDEKYEEVDD